MQRIYNYGSSLQAYSLGRMLEEAGQGVKASFIDYIPGEALIRDHAAVSGGEVGRLLAKVRKYGQVDTSVKNKLRFFNHKRHYGARYYPLVGIEAEKRHSTSVDLQVIGSDEVFNCVQSNVNVGFSPDLFGIGSDARYVASYAASFGNTTLKKLDDARVRDQVARGLRSFSAVSVRDRNSANIVSELVGQEAPPVHLDPTLVYPLMQDPQIPRGRLRNEDYLIVYGYSGRFTRDENDAIRRYADKHALRVFAFGGLQKSADEFIDCSPFELLAYFRDASAVVTDTFHGTIFSVINEVPFATSIRRSQGDGYGNEEKLSYLLQRLGLESRALIAPNALDQLLQEQVDFTDARGIREAEAVRSRDYLSRICREAGIRSGAE